MIYSGAYTHLFYPAKLIPVTLSRFYLYGLLTVIFHTGTWIAVAFIQASPIKHLSLILQGQNCKMRRGCSLCRLLLTPPPPHSGCPPLHCHLYLFIQLLWLLQDIPDWLTASLGLVCVHPHFCNVLIMSRSADCTDMSIITCRQWASILCCACLICDIKKMQSFCWFLV